jgi:hypothetical protein
MMELEVFGSGLLLDGYHRFSFSVAANSKPLRSVATGISSASFVPPIALLDRWLSPVLLASILWHKPC